MTRAFARLVIRLRYAVVVFWIAATAAATLMLPAIGESGGGALGDLVPSDTDAIQAELRALDLFDFPLLARTVVVQRSEGGLSAAAQGRVVERALNLNEKAYPELQTIEGALAITNLLGQPPFSLERSSTAITYLFFTADKSRGKSFRAAQRFIKRIGERDSPIGATGALPAREVRENLIADNLTRIDVATLLLVTLIVALYFRSLVAPLVNLAAVGTAYLVSIRIVAAIGEEIGVSVPREVSPVIVALLFGVMTDYTLFFLSPFRRRLTEIPDVRTAAEQVIAQQFPIVLTAGLTVAAASASLVVARLEFFQAFGPGVALAALVGTAVTLTLVPALVAIGGRWLFWPRRPQHVPRWQRAGRARDAARGVNARGLRFAARRPVIAAGATLLVLLVAASGLLRLELGNPLIRDLPESAEPLKAYRAATAGFAAGILSPTVIVVERPGITVDRERLDRLQTLLSRQPGVAQVLGPREQPTRLDLGGVFARNGDAARFALILDSDPYGTHAIKTVSRLRGRLQNLLDRANLPAARASIAGDTAIVAETVDKTKDDLGRISLAVFTAVFLVLALFLRALVAPLYLVAASALALAATLGLTTYMFQDVLGKDELTFYVPFASAVLLVALGSDYNIFLAGRIWLEARHRPLRQAVVVAGEGASGAIGAAAVVLAGSFALMAIVPLTSFREIAFAMSVGLLIDAFLVRAVLVPALIVLFAERSGWPGGRLRRKQQPFPETSRLPAPPLPPAPESPQTTTTPEGERLTALPTSLASERQTPQTGADPAGEAQAGGADPGVDARRRRAAAAGALALGIVGAALGTLGRRSGKTRGGRAVSVRRAVRARGRRGRRG